MFASRTGAPGAPDEGVTYWAMAQTDSDRARLRRHVASKRPETPEGTHMPADPALAPTATPRRVPGGAAA